MFKEKKERRNWGVQDAERYLGIEKINTSMGIFFHSFARGVPNCLLWDLVFFLYSMCFSGSLLDVSVKATCVDMPVCPAGRERCCASERLTERDLLRWDLGDSC